MACACDDGYEGARCELCAPGHARSEFGECLQLLLTGGGDVQPEPDTCTDTTCHAHGQCNDAAASIQCSCFPGYVGARCDDCAQGYALRGERCVADSPCEAGECGACQSFDDSPGFPERPDNCVSTSDFELDDVRPESLQSSGTVWLCGPHQAYGFGSPHIVLEAGTSMPAELTFRVPIAQLRFDFGARSFGPGERLTLELSADGALVDTLDVERGASGTQSYSFETPISVFGLRSLGQNTEDVALDNLVYELAMCSE